MAKLKQDNQFVRSTHFKEEHIPFYQHFPFNLPVVRHFETLMFHPNVTYIMDHGNVTVREYKWKQIV